MPKNKPSQKVSLTKTKKKGLESKHIFIDEIRKCVDEYENIFVFSYENMRNKFMTEIRMKWSDNSRFFFCKNKIMALGLGRTSAEEVSENLHLISEKLVGKRGLYFTNSTKEEVLKYFDNLKMPDYARAGAVATETYEIPEGLLNQFPHSLEPHLRKLGLPTELKRGIPALIKPFLVCKEGDILNPEQAKILKLFEEQMAYFKMTMEFLWSKGGSFEDLGRTNGVVFTKKPKKKPNAVEKKEKIDLDGEETSPEEQMEQDEEEKEEG